MKTLNTYINEKLVLNKGTFKSNYKYFPKTNEELQDIIYQLLKERKKEDVIDLNDIDTSMITDMSEVFSGYNTKKIDISKWDVSNVESMYGMFNSCMNLKSVGDLSIWNVSRVTDMSRMFEDCYELKSTGDLSDWNTGKVGHMKNMFFNCDELEYIGDISEWDVSNVESMENMFLECGELKSVGDLNKWNIGKLKNMKFMFDESGITNIPEWYKW